MTFKRQESYVDMGPKCPMSWTEQTLSFFSLVSLVINRPSCVSIQPLDEIMTGLLEKRQQSRLINISYWCCWIITLPTAGWVRYPDGPNDKASAAAFPTARNGDLTTAEVGFSLQKRQLGAKFECSSVWK